MGYVKSLFLKGWRGANGEIFWYESYTQFIEYWEDLLVRRRRSLNGGLWSL